MSDQTFVKDQRVALRGNSTPFQRGTVVGTTKPMTSGLGVQLPAVVVEWDNGNVQKVTARSLMNESEADAEEAKLTAEQSKMEEEFEVARAKIAAKMNESAAALREAAKLAKEAGADLQDFYDETRPLLRAMDAAGWSTSSLSC